MTRIGVTGSPATGKKSVGVELAKMTGLELVLINEFAMSRGLGKLEKGEFMVDVRRTGRDIQTDNKIVCGHLLPYVVPKSKIDFVAVLRTSPMILKKRFLERGYSPSKITENLEAELIGVIAAKALSVYGLTKIAEFDASKSTSSTIARKILETINGKRRKSFGEIDWLDSQHAPHDLLKSLQALLQNHKG